MYAMPWLAVRAELALDMEVPPRKTMSKFLFCFVLFFWERNIGRSIDHPAQLSRPPFDVRTNNSSHIISINSRCLSAWL